jgi:hypothetical protein
MKRIDSSTDVALTQYEGGPEDTTREIILKVAGELFPPVGVVTALREHFSSKKKYEQIKQVFLALNDEVGSLKKESAQDQARIQAIEERLQSPKFTEAVLTAAEEAVRTADSNKLDRLACVLANGLDPRRISDEDDLASFVRDASQLTEMDIQVLKIIHSTFADLIPMNPNFNNPNAFTDRSSELLKNVNEAGIDRDDFYSYSSRLAGFGLTLEAPFNPSRQAPGDKCFRPTRRGEKLVALLQSRILPGSRRSS